MWVMKLSVYIFIYTHIIYQCICNYMLLYIHTVYVCTHIYVHIYIYMYATIEVLNSQIGQDIEQKIKINSGIYTNKYRQVFINKKS